MKIIANIFIVVLALVLAAIPAAAQSAERVDVLIGFGRQPGPAEEAMVREADGTIKFTFHLVPVIAANVPEPAIDGLLKQPGVRYIEPDHEVYAIEQTVPWSIDRVFGAESYPFPTWGDSRGAGIAVAVLDTGIGIGGTEGGVHEDLIILGGYSAVPGPSGKWRDGYGHGTHVAGTIAALDNDLGVAGVGPLVGLYAVKVLRDDGSGFTSYLIEGIQWAVDQGIPVLNMSLAFASFSQSVKDACDEAYLAGHLLVAAAGNDGNEEGTGDNVGYPAGYSSVIAVAASDSDDQRASFSSTGPAVELIAPGVGVLSTWIDSRLWSSVTVEGLWYESRPLVDSGLDSVTGPLIDRGLALEVGPYIDGVWVALIDRGEVTFAEKVRNVMDEGADAAIIVNNDTTNPDDPGSFTLDDPNYPWVPTVSVSYNSGLEIRANKELGEGTVTVGYGPYRYASGTSMASPHAAGVAALAWAANPDLSNTQIRAILQETAEDLALPAEHQGYGLVRADLAVAMALVTEPPAEYTFTAPSAVALGDMSPSATPYTDNSTDGSLVGDNVNGYTVTGKDEKTENTGYMVIGENILSNKLLIGPAADTLGPADEAQTFLDTSGLTDAAIALHVSQLVDYTDVVATGYTITITFTVTEK